MVDHLRPRGVKLLSQNRLKEGCSGGTSEIYKTVLGDELGLPGPEEPTVRGGSTGW